MANYIPIIEPIVRIRTDGLRYVLSIDDGHSGISRYADIEDLLRLRGQIDAIVYEREHGSAAESKIVTEKVYPIPIAKQMPEKVPPRHHSDPDDDDYDDGDLGLDPTDELAPRAKTGRFATKANLLIPSVTDVGRFVDKITRNNARLSRRVFTRALEEMAELGLKLGATPSDMYMAVSDSVHNQCLKIGGRTMFPSRFVENFNIKEAISELADVRIVLKDLMHVSYITEDDVLTAEHTKWKKLKSNPPANFTTDSQTFYLKKSHIVD